MPRELGCQHPQQDGPLHPPPLGMRETEAQGSDTAGRKATASQEGTELRRHQILDPKLTLYSRLPSEQRSGRLHTGWWVRQGERGGEVFYIHIFIYKK